MELPLGSDMGFFFDSARDDSAIYGYGHTAAWFSNRAKRNKNFLPIPVFLPLVAFYQMGYGDQRKAKEAAPNRDCLFVKRHSWELLRTSSRSSRNRTARCYHRDHPGSR